MGKMKHLETVRRFFEKTPVASTRDIALITRDRDYTRLLLFNLIRRGEIYRLTKGCYTKHEDPTLAVFCFRPAYLGLQEALTIHNLWEQETNPVILTPRPVRTGIRQVLETNIIVRRIDKKYFFGFDTIKYGDFYLPVSDIEKTLIDLAHFNELPDRRVLLRIKKAIDPTKLRSYLRAYPRDFRKKVLELVS